MSGRLSRVIEVEDESGSMPLILWNEDVELAKSLRTGDELVVKGAYERNGELHLGYSGKMDVVSRAEFTDLDKLENGQMVHVRGVVGAVEGHDNFVEGTKTRPAFSFMVSDGRHERRCVIWEGTARADNLKQGDEVIIENAAVDNDNINIDGSTRILTRRTKEMIIGEIKKLECDNEKLVAWVEDKEIELDREDGLKFLGVEVAGDIRLSTVLALKKDSLLNNKIAVKTEEKGGKIHIRG